MRIRSIKPEFWRSDDIDQHDWHIRLVFIGLWSYVDDNGVGVDKLSDIVADLFAYDFSRDPRETLARVATALDALAEKGQIARYLIHGRRYLFIVEWDKHQRVDRPNKARYPRPTCDNTDPRESVASPSRDLSANVASGAVEQRSSGTEEQGLKDSSSAKPMVRSKYPVAFEQFWKIYPRKVGKDKAVKAWRTALKRSDPAEITAGLERMLADPNFVDDQFVPHPTTWINRGGWNDGPLLPRIPDRGAQPSRHDENADAVHRMQLREQALRNGNGNHQPQLAIEANR